MSFVISPLTGRAVESVGVKAPTSQSRSVAPQPPVAESQLPSDSLLVNFGGTVPTPAPPQADPQQLNLLEPPSSEQIQLDFGPAPPVANNNPTVLLAEASTLTPTYKADLHVLDQRYPGVAQRLTESDALAEFHNYDQPTASALEMQVLKNPPWPAGHTSQTRLRISEKAAELQGLHPELKGQRVEDYDFGKAQEKADGLLEQLDQMFPPDQYPDVKLAARAKTPGSLEKKLEKLQRRDPNFSLAHLTDTVGARIDCADLSQVGSAAHKLEKQYEGKIVARADYLSDPGENGYRALHYIVDMGDRMAEIQLTTHKLRATDLATHDTVYKELVPVADETKEKLAGAADRAMYVECLQYLGVT